nr:hypothetical protein [Proteus mirabilis]
MRLKVCPADRQTFSLSPPQLFRYGFAAMTGLFPSVSYANGNYHSGKESCYALLHGLLSFIHPR